MSGNNVLYLTSGLMIGSGAVRIGAYEPLWGLGIFVGLLMLIFTACAEEFQMISTIITYWIGWLACGGITMCLGALLLDVELDNALQTIMVIFLWPLFASLLVLYFVGLFATTVYMLARKIKRLGGAEVMSREDIVMGISLALVMFTALLTMAHFIP